MGARRRFRIHGPDGPNSFINGSADGPIPLRQYEPGLSRRFARYGVAGRAGMLLESDKYSPPDVRRTRRGSRQSWVESNLPTAVNAGSSMEIPADGRQPGRKSRCRFSIGDQVGILVMVSFVLFVNRIFVVSDIRSLWDKKKDPHTCCSRTRMESPRFAGLVCRV